MPTGCWSSPCRVVRTQTILRDTTRCWRRRLARTLRTPCAKLAAQMSRTAFYLTNGFDPRWGTPPATYEGVALAFEPTTGTYAFDRAYALAHSPKDSAGRPLHDTFALDRLERGYGSNLVLAPWKPTLSSPWSFRWQARVAPPRIVCETG
jgi:hypothetical protein